MLVCNYCGYITHHALGALGLLDNIKTKDDEMADSK